MTQEQQPITEFNFHNPWRKSIWGKATDFDNLGQQIKILNFEILQKNEGNPPAKYVAEDWNGTYRLTYENTADEKKIYENRYHQFCDDLKGKIKPNQLGVLKRSRIGKIWKWEWRPLE